jgi:NAD(P)-dependent dehydrogenase (short-subunit alcohol dehydrogenase family)
MIARGLVQAGARIIVASRKTEDVEAAARGLAAVGDCQAIPADISTPGALCRSPLRSASASIRSIFP